MTNAEAAMKAAEKITDKFWVFNDKVNDSGSLPLEQIKNTLTAIILETLSRVRVEGEAAGSEPQQLLRDLASLPVGALMDEHAPRSAIMGVTSILRHMQSRATDYLSSPALRSEGRWLPISDAPRGVSVLLGAVGCSVVVEGYAEYITDICTDRHKPTHFMPKPAPPSKENSNE